MNDFIFRMLTTVRFGAGSSRRAGEECARLGAKRVFFVTDPFMRDHSKAFPIVMESLRTAGLEVSVYSDVESDPCVETVDRAAAAMKEYGADMVLALGGGSPMDCAKSVAMLQANEGSIRDYMRKKKTISAPAKPVICIPTTAGTGSEVTAAAVTTDRQAGEKIGLSHDSMMPVTALVDPELHLDMPPALTAATGLDALCHAVEAYTGVASEPVSDALCISAIRMIGENIGIAYASGQDIEARSAMALASLMAGAGFNNASLGLVHGIAHCLGAMYRVPHGIANAIMLPYVMEFNAPAAPEKFTGIARALEADISGLTAGEASLRASAKVRQMCVDLGVPLTLKEASVQKSDIPVIVKNTLTYARLPNNIRKVTGDDIERILTGALG